jgi:carboxyl-terminal processing protease
MKSTLVTCLFIISFSVFAQHVVTKPNGQKVFETGERGQSIYDTVSLQTRMLGLAMFWKEASYNFVFFDRLQINWDSAYYAFIPKMAEAKTVYDYWKVLNAFARLLNDGHTAVYGMDYFWKDIGNAPLSWTRINNRRFVSRIDDRLLEEIPLGTEVVAVNDQPVDEYLAQGNLMSGVKGTSIMFTFKRRDGEEFKKTIERVAGKDHSVKYYPPFKPWKDFEYKALDKKIAYVKINTFDNDSIPIKFAREVASINKMKALIVDVRGNGGGNTAYAIGVAQHLTNRPFMTGSAWKTRIHNAARKAWGSVPNDDEWTKQNFNYLVGNEWETHAGEKISIPKSVQRVKVPILVLIGENTFSAAEDFLILLDGSDNIKLMGQPTAGSSGQPLMIDLPAGFTARICAKRDTYPDGRDFIGTGIKPDILINRVVDDYLNDVDTELNEAIRFLTDK